MMSEERRDILREIIQEEMKPMLEHMSNLQKEIIELKQIILKQAR